MREHDLRPEPEHAGAARVIPGRCVARDLRFRRIKAQRRQSGKDIGLGIEHADLGCPRPPHGSLSKWVAQGVLLLNATLTVRRGAANSHERAGWAPVTDAAVAALSARAAPAVFLLWGKFAEKKAAGVDRGKHAVLVAPHPSGLSAARGFFGCAHFSKANAELVKRGMEPIDWDRSTT